MQTISIHFVRYLFKSNANFSQKKEESKYDSS